MEAAMEMVSRVTRTSNSVKINEHQCKRLAQVYEEIGSHLFLRRVKSSINMEPLLKVMEAGELLVSQCAGRDWFQTAVVNAENKEAFEELHRDLHLWFRTIFSTELMTSKFDHTTDAIHDAKTMLETLENIQKSKGGQNQSLLTVAIFRVRGRAQLLEEEASGVPQAYFRPTSFGRLEDQAAFVFEKRHLGKYDEAQIRHENYAPPNYRMKREREETLIGQGSTAGARIRHENSAPPNYRMKREREETLIGQGSTAGARIMRKFTVPPEFRIKMSEIEVREETLIGEGSTAVVKKADWLGTPCAVKIFTHQHEAATVREMELHAELRSVYVVKLFGLAVEGNKCMALMELMDFNLHDLILEKQRKLPSGLSKLVFEDQSPFPLQDAVGLMLQIAKGMNYLHAVHHILHGDLKTDNILVQHIGKDNYRLKISDFGISEKLSTEKPTVSGIRGSSYFRAPEVLQRTVDYSLKADVYSFAMISYEILTGRRPFDGKRMDSRMIEQVISGRRPLLPGNLHGGLSDLVQQCWHQDWLTRPNFSEIFQELESMENWLVYEPRRREGVWGGRFFLVMMGFIAFWWWCRFNS